MYKATPGSSLSAKTPELEEYFKWACENGVRLFNAEYPCLFPPGYPGIVASSSFEPYSTIISVPNHLLITCKVAENSELGDLFHEYEDLFDEDDTHYEDLVLITFIIWEKYKGEKSKWFHFIRNQPTHFDVLQDWSVEELQMLQDSEVVFDTKQSIAGCMKRYGEWKKVMLKSKLFTPEMTEYKEFLWVYRLLATRTFGKFCPHTTFAPIAEFINHNNTATYYYYGTDEASAQCAKRYVNFYVGQDNDDDLTFKKPVSNLSWKKVAEVVLQRNVERDSPFFKLVKEGEACDSEESKHLSSDYGKPDPEVLRESNDKSLTILTGNEFYENGSQLFMSYGRYSNRMLLSTYGFALENNFYDYARVVVSFDLLCPEENSWIIRDLDSRNLYLFKIKQDVICKDFLKLTRALNWNQSFSIDACFSPADVNLEITAISTVLKVLNERLASFPTSLETDQELLRQNHPIRSHFAVLFN
jgi:hypothetical protein